MTLDSKGFLPRYYEFPKKPKALSGRISFLWYRAGVGGGGGRILADASKKSRVQGFLGH